MIIISKPVFVLLIASIITLTIINLSGFTVFLHSQEEVPPPVQPTPVQSTFLNPEFVYGLVGALGVLVPIISGLILWLRRTVNRTTEEFIKSQTEQAKQNKEDNQRFMETINNNVNAKFLDTKEDIIEIKRTIDTIDEKMDKQKDSTTVHGERLREHDRRISNLERSGGPSSGLGGGGGAPNFGHP